MVETDRLRLRKLTTKDAAFILRLVNEPSWLRFIGDKQVRTLADARSYIHKGPVAMYRKFGFGLFLVERDNRPIGICGLLKRESLDDVDLGFAFLPEYWGKGYAYEAAKATLDYARTTLNLSRVVAVTSQDNVAAARLLEKLGFRFERKVKLTPTAPEVRLFVPFKAT